MEKKKKITLIISLSLVSTFITYFGGGLIATAVVNENLINVRGSTIETLKEDDFYRIQYIREDYDSLKEREEVPFKCNNNTLMGYLYTVENPKGVIITAHGVNALADGTHAQFHDYMVRNNWDVFSFDMTGCGRSSGRGMKTLFESRYCVINAVKTVQNHEKTKDLPICLLGHSWGAYGVVTASKEFPEIKAVASFSGFNQPAEIMYGFAEYYASPAVIVTKPSLDLALYTLFGDPAFYVASSVVRSNKGTNYIVVHGDRDEVVPLKTYSLYDNVANRGLANVTSLLIEDTGHVGPWKTNESNHYIDDVLMAHMDDLHKQYPDGIPEDVYNEYIDSIDKEKSSAINTDLFDQIFTIFENSYK